MDRTDNSAYELCSLASIPPGEAREVIINRHGQPQSIVVVRQSDRVYAYVNRCPHTGVSLNWLADQFLNLDGDLIQCATHGALFRIQDGYCLWGPCAGDALTPIAVAVQTGQVVLIDPD